MEYKAISLLIKDIENILDSLFLSGLNSVSVDTSKNCINIAQECKKYGLEFAGEKLMFIANAIESRRHAVEYDFDDVVGEFCVLCCYLNVVRSKLELECIEAEMLAFS